MFNVVPAFPPGKCRRVGVHQSRPRPFLSSLFAFNLSVSSDCHDLCVTIDGAWIDERIYWPLETTSNYSSIANLHTLQITTAPAMPFSSLLFLHQPFPGNGFNSEDSWASLVQVVFTVSRAELNSQLTSRLAAISHQPPSLLFKGWLWTSRFLVTDPTDGDSSASVVTPLPAGNTPQPKRHLFTASLAELSSQLTARFRVTLQPSPLRPTTSIFFSTEHLRLLSLWNILSKTRMGLSFTIAAGPHQRSHSRVRVPLDSRSYFDWLGSPNCLPYNPFARTE
jgi:hypothetical protein